jgi:hypothetical protein
VDNVNKRLVAQKDEHRTSNVQHRILNEKNEKTGIYAENSLMEVSFSFDVGRSMFDVHFFSVGLQYYYEMNFKKGQENDFTFNT